MKLFDGCNHPVRFTAAAIKKAILGDTSIVLDREECCTISVHESEEVDVTIKDGEQAVFEMSEIDEAVREFMAGVQHDTYALMSR